MTDRYQSAEQVLAKHLRLFPQLQGRHVGRSRRDFRKPWKTACTKAGVPGRIFHDFQRTAVRNLERAGVPRSVAMKITGHRTENAYRRYAIVSDADLRAAAAKLAGTFSRHTQGAMIESRTLNS